MNEQRKNALVGQSGGPTSAINATLAGVIDGAQALLGGTLYGMRNGMEGLLEGRLVDLSARFASADSRAALALTPAAALGSCRVKLPPPEKDPALYERIFAQFDALNVGAFFYIGGNDSMDTCLKLSAWGRAAGSPVRIVGVPKTIDNDLCRTDHAPGYGSAAKFIAVSMLEMARDCAVYTTPAVTIVEIMGRDAGWLTAASALARLAGGGPDLIYLPEVPFSVDRFLQDVRAVLARKPAVMVAVSEGVRDESGNYAGQAAQSGAVDAFGHRYLSGVGHALEAAVREAIGCKVRSVELNILQRCAGHLASDTDIRESRRIGYAAVEAASRGESGVVPIFVRKGPEYAVDIALADVADIAGQVRQVPRAWINEAGNDVLPPLIDYMRPLIRGEVPVAFENGLPRHVVL